MSGFGVKRYGSYGHFTQSAQRFVSPFSCLRSAALQSTDGNKVGLPLSRFALHSLLCVTVQPLASRIRRQFADENSDPSGAKPGKAAVDTAVTKPKARAPAAPVVAKRVPAVFVDPDILSADNSAAIAPPAASGGSASGPGPSSPSVARGGSGSGAAKASTPSAQAALQAKLGAFKASKEAKAAAASASTAGSGALGGQLGKRQRRDSDCDVHSVPPFRADPDEVCWCRVCALGMRLSELV